MLPSTKLTQFRIAFARKTFGTVLDCGCGQGAYQPYFTAERIISLDRACSQLSHIKTPKLCADAVRLPFKDNSFDCLWSCGMLQYLNGDLGEIIARWKQVVKTGGKIYILTPNKTSWFDRIKKIFGFKGWDSQGPVVKLYTAEELKKFGKVYGEISLLPFLNRFLAILPQLGHSLMLEIDVIKNG